MFQPVLPLSGLPGWIFLNRTMESQTKAFNAAPEIVRDTEYFEANIATVTTAKDLVNDRRLLRVALGAFGLQQDIDNRFLIQKVLEAEPSDPASLANALADDRYKQLNQAFGFGDKLFGPHTSRVGFGAEIAKRFRSRSFEVAVGEQSESLRLAMNAMRELAEIGQDGATENARWYRILGTPPLRRVFETAFGLPDGFGQLDIERQLEIFKDSARQKLGVEHIDAFADAATRDKLIKTFLLRDQINALQGQSSSAIALSLLQGG